MATFLKSPLLAEESERPNRERRARAGILPAWDYCVGCANLRRFHWRRPCLQSRGGLRPRKSAILTICGFLFISDDIFRSQRDDDFCMVSLWVTPSNLIATAAIDFSRTQWSVRVAQWPRPGLARPICRRRRVWQAGSLHIFR